VPVAFLDVDGDVSDNGTERKVSPLQINQEIMLHQNVRDIDNQHYRPVRKMSVQSGQRDARDQ
jgi:hypothetical protein